MDNQKVKKYKTEEERKNAIRRSKTHYMLSKIWYCEVYDREYCLAGKTQNFLNRPLELDHLEPEDESIETLLNMFHTQLLSKTILNNSKLGSAFKNT